MILEALVVGTAATYLHKKFPRTTEAVAKGVTNAGKWAIKATARQILKHEQPVQPKACCIAFFHRHPEQQFCIRCGAPRPTELPPLEEAASPESKQYRKPGLEFCWKCQGHHEKGRPCP